MAHGDAAETIGEAALCSPKEGVAATTTSRAAGAATSRAANQDLLHNFSQLLAVELQTLQRRLLRAHEEIFGITHEACFWLERPRLAGNNEGEIDQPAQPGIRDIDASKPLRRQSAPARLDLRRNTVDNAEPLVTGGLTFGGPRTLDSTASLVTSGLARQTSQSSTTRFVYGSSDQSLNSVTPENQTSMVSKQSDQDHTLQNVRLEVATNEVQKEKTPANGLDSNASDIHSLLQQVLKSVEGLRSTEDGRDSPRSTMFGSRPSGFGRSTQLGTLGLPSRHRAKPLSQPGSARTSSVMPAIKPESSTFSTTNKPTPATSESRKVSVASFCSVVIPPLASQESDFDEISGSGYNTLHSPPDLPQLSDNCSCYSCYSGVSGASYMPGDDPGSIVKRKSNNSKLGYVRSRVSFDGARKSLQEMRRKSGRVMERMLSTRSSRTSALRMSHATTTGSSVLSKKSTISTRESVTSNWNVAACASISEVEPSNFVGESERDKQFFVVKKEWTKAVKKASKGKDGREGVHSFQWSLSAKASDLNVALSEDAAARRSGYLKVMIQPNGMRRLCWDVLSMLFLAYDAVVIPLAFMELEETAGMATISWICRIFWMVDVLVSFCTGYMLSNGDIELHPTKIARHYLKTWFILDITLVTVDLAMLLSMSNSSREGAESARMSRTMRTMRFFRMVRLARMIKFPATVSAIIAHIRSEKFVVVISIIKTLGLIIAIVHIIACMWFYIGNSDDRGWVTMQTYKDEKLEFQYGTSFHWALTQFAGSMEIHPWTTQERYYCIFVLLFAFLFATWLVSSLTSSMTQLHMTAARQSQLFSILQKYLMQRGISRKLASRIQMNAKHQWRQLEHKMPEDDVELLKLVSEPLRMKLHYEISKPILANHPLLALMAEVIPTSMQKLCHVALSRTSFSRGDVLFSTGEVPNNPSVLFVESGTLRYWLHRKVDSITSEKQVEKEISEAFSEKKDSPGAASLAASEYVMSYSTLRNSSELGTGHWASEGVLWTSWLYCGELRAEDETVLLLLNAAKFIEVSLSGQLMQLNPSLYGSALVDGINSGDIPCSDACTDIDSEYLMVRAFGAESLIQSSSAHRTKRTPE